MIERHIQSSSFIFDTYPEIYACQGGFGGEVYLGPVFLNIFTTGLRSFPFSDDWVLDYSGNPPMVYPHYPYYFFYPYPMSECTIIPSIEETTIYAVCDGELIRGDIVEINYNDQQILFGFDYNPEWEGPFPPESYPTEVLLDVHVGILIDNPVWALRIEGNFNHNINILGAELRIRYNIYTGPKTLVIKGEAPIGDEWHIYEYNTSNFFARPRLNTVLTYDLDYGSGYQTIDIYPIIEEMINHPNWQDGRITHLFLTTL